MKYFVSKNMYKLIKRKLYDINYIKSRKFEIIYEVAKSIDFISALDTTPIKGFVRWTYKAWIYLLDLLKYHSYRDCINFMREITCCYISDKCAKYMILQHPYLCMKYICGDFKWTRIRKISYDWGLNHLFESTNWSIDKNLNKKYSRLDWSLIISHGILTINVLRWFPYYINWKPLIKKDSSFLRRKTSRETERMCVRFIYEDFKRVRNIYRKQIKGSLRKKNRYVKSKMEEILRTL